jgi:leader peptidase (prepilin peptidase)/N-methyltransferase
MSPAAWALVAVSPFVGSFLATAAGRLPGDAKGLLSGRSRCDHCRHPLAWPDLVPIMSFLALRGRCRSCGAPIPRHHPAIELATLAIALAAVAVAAPAMAAILALVGWWLLLLAVIDLRSRTLPDALTLPLIAAGLAEAALVPGETPADRLIGAALGYAAFAGLAALYRRLRGREGLGLGDAKLLAAGGAWLGWAALPMIVLLAATAALAAAFISGRTRAGSLIAFGPWLAAAIWGLMLRGTLADTPLGLALWTGALLSV